MARVAIGIGSNVGEPLANVERACAALRRLGEVRAISPFYVTKAWGLTAQPDFINAVVLLETETTPRTLLAQLQALETELGRSPTTSRWGPRTIDLDILTYDRRELVEPDLVLPHARLFERAFALAPLADLDPSFGPALAALPPAQQASVQRIPAAAARSRSLVDWDETLARVRSAAEFCTTAGLARFRIDEADFAIEIRRDPRAGSETATNQAQPGAPAGEIVPSTNGSAVPDDGLSKVVVKAEFVGIVRLARPTVAEGAVLADDRELAFVESLGIRNPVRAGGPGRILEVLVVDGQAVEYGQPLFAIEH